MLRKLKLNGCLHSVFSVMVGVSAVLAQHSFAWAADDFPSKVIKIQVPTGPGGTADIIARLVASRMADTWKTGVIVENRVGAGGVIGTNIVAKSAPDGYTLGLATTSFTTNASTNPKLPYDAMKDFVPIALLANSSYYLVSSPNIPVQSVKDLIALAKEKPGVLNYASAGVGGSYHLAFEMFNAMAGVKLTHIPFQEPVPAANAVIAGEVQVTYTNVSGMAQVQTGKMRLLAIASGQRNPQFPNLPTIAETVPGYVFNNWFGLLAPYGVPAEILAKLRTNVQHVLQLKDVRERLVTLGLESVNVSSEQFAERIAQEIKQYTAIVKDLKIIIER